MLPRRFVKMAGGGNDFLVFEADGRSLSDSEKRQLALACRRGLSVGADGALLLSRGELGRVRLDYFNADGGLASFCANGTRCAARYAAMRHLSLSGDDPILETGWGPIPSHVRGAEVTLDLPVESLAPPLRRHAALPHGANVNFVEVENPHGIAVRTFERGVEGETLACGSGVVASAVAAAHLGRVDPPVVCRTKSRVAFTVRFEETGKQFTRIALTGDAREIFGGELTEEAFQP